MTPEEQARLDPATDPADRYGPHAAEILQVLQHATTITQPLRYHTSTADSAALDTARRRAPHDAHRHATNALAAVVDTLRPHVATSPRTWLRTSHTLQDITTAIALRDTLTTPTQRTLHNNVMRAYRATTTGTPAISEAWAA